MGYVNSKAGMPKAGTRQEKIEWRKREGESKVLPVGFERF